MEGRAGSSPEGMTRRRSLGTGVMGCNRGSPQGWAKQSLVHLGDSLELRPGGVGAAQGVGRGHVGYQGAASEYAAGSRSPRTAECGSPCPPWGKACYYCEEGKREIRGQYWGHYLLPFHTASRASPFLAESNTHEAGLVGPVGFHSDSLPVQLPRLLRRETGRRKGQNS